MKSIFLHNDEHSQHITNSAHSSLVTRLSPLAIRHSPLATRLSSLVIRHSFREVHADFSFAFGVNFSPVGIAEPVLGEVVG